MVTQGQKSCRLGRQREPLPGEASRRAVAEEAGPAAGTPGRGAPGSRGQADGAPSGAAVACCARGGKGSRLPAAGEGEAETSWSRPAAGRWRDAGRPGEGLKGLGAKQAEQ